MQLSDVCATLLKETAKAGIDPDAWFAEQIAILEKRAAPKAVEIETLQLIRDGLRAERLATKPIRKTSKSKLSNRK